MSLSTVEYDSAQPAAEGGGYRHDGGCPAKHEMERLVGQMSSTHLSIFRHANWRKSLLAKI